MLLLAAFSIDWFGCDRDEGYAAFALPTPGKSCVVIAKHCLKDTSTESALLL